MKRQERMLAMLVTLQERHRSTAEELAEQFGVSERTVLRDVAALAAVDVPIFAERGRYGGIVLLPGTQIDLARLGKAETEVLQLLGLDLVATRQLGMGGPATRLVAKASAAQRHARAHEGPRTSLSLADVVTVDHRGWFEPASEADVAALAADLRTGDRLRIRYRSSGSPDASWRTVDPYGLLLRAGRWYLVADESGVPRLYAVTRLERWAATSTPRRLREGISLDALARELANRLESGYDVVVTADLGASRRDLAERILGTRLIAIEPGTHPGTVRMKIAYAELGGVRQLLQFAEHICVLDPPEAKRLIHDLTRRMAEEHG